ncbi:protein FAM104A-like [Rattus rattus]|uniref:protein FAM104A-like n=1 Tax=Rattus rattus TaxID=10117 RepID=UPI0013F2DD14|nr:protein FAM104A-like [Rattus rattus]
MLIWGKLKLGFEVHIDFLFDMFPPLPNATCCRIKRGPDDNEDENHHPPRSKRTRKDQALQDPRAMEATSSENRKNQTNINNPNHERVPENDVNQSTAKLDSSIPGLSQKEEYEVCQDQESYSHINNILKEAHFYSLQKRRHSLS